MKADASRAAGLLKATGLRKTPVRTGVIDILSASRQPLDVPQIIAKLPSHTDAVTVYRTLNTFARKKLVHRVRGEDRSWRYAMGDAQVKDSHRHPHFVCERCGKVECLSLSKIPDDLVKLLHIGKAYSVSYAEVVLHGYCQKCA
jgi:Fur family ferric uptake transcriptional regulator